MLPPDLALLAAVALELRQQYSVKNHSRQRVAGLSCDQIRSCRFSPDLEQLFGGDLIGDMPLGDPALGGGGKDRGGDTHLVLKLHAGPVFWT